MFVVSFVILDINSHVRTANVEFARYIVEHGFIQLSVAFKMVSPNVSYFVTKTGRKHLQMPLAAIDVGEKKTGTYFIYLVEKKIIYEV